MLCPFCGKEMVQGRIWPLGMRNTFWLPRNVKNTYLGFRFLTVKSVERAGGRILGTSTKFDHYAIYESDTQLCEECNVLVTKV